MSQALYRKYRSRRLDEVLGQEHVTSILRAALAQGKIAHAYLLTGPRGVGKTSVARILAHEINALPYDEGATHLDIIEIDAASNNGVDDIRMLREKAQVAPVSAAKKIYIIDEVHMLSKPAFNALLKTLEEPPAHVVFILATTDADKLPATILSRVQQFYFHPISVEVMAGQLMKIAASEGFGVDEAAARMIAEQSRGGFRDGISLLDQLSPLAAETPLTTEVVAAHLGLSGEATLRQLVAAWQAHDGARALELLRGLEADGADPVILAGQLMQLARRQLVDEPALVELISQLIDVTRHPHPDLKLLTIFVKHSAKPESPNDSASEYTLRAAKAGPWRSADGDKSPVTASSSESLGDSGANNSTQSNNSSKASSGHSRPAASGTPAEEEATPPAPEAVKRSRIAGASAERSREISSGDLSEKSTLATDGGAGSETSRRKPTLDWHSLLDRVKTDSPGRYSMLAKSGWQLDGHRLTIFAGQKLAAAKLDDAKFRPQLAQIITELTGQELDIIITPAKKPPADAKLAEIAAMMGGGEEVNLEELTRE